MARSAVLPLIPSSSCHEVGSLPAVRTASGIPGEGVTGTSVRPQFNRFKELMPKFAQFGFAEPRQRHKTFNNGIWHNTSNRLINIAACLPIIIKSIVRSGSDAFCANDSPVSRCILGVEAPEIRLYSHYPQTIQTTGGFKCRLLFWWRIARLRSSSCVM
jgi:hypothetical protein